MPSAGFAGATDTDRPYIVMELVPGMRIVDYDDQHNLTTCARRVLALAVFSYL